MTDDDGRSLTGPATDRRVRAGDLRHAVVTPLPEPSASRQPPPPRVLGVVLLEADHSVETLDSPDPFSWQPPEGLAPGFFGHPKAWPVPAVFAVAAGATGRSSADGAPHAMRGVAGAVRRLDGRCDMIVGGCGFFGLAWPLLDPRPRTPTVLSALDFLDVALAASRRDVAVISTNTADGRHAVASHPAADRIRVAGLDGVGDWSAFAEPDWAHRPAWTMTGLEQGLRQILSRAAQPGGLLDSAGAVLLECTVLPQFRSVIREYTSAPIYDLVNIVRATLA